MLSVSTSGIADQDPAGRRRGEVDIVRADRVVRYRAQPRGAAITSASTASVSIVRAVGGPGAGAQDVGRWRQPLRPDLQVVLGGHTSSARPGSSLVLNTHDTPRSAITAPAARYPGAPVTAPPGWRPAAQVEALDAVEATPVDPLLE